MKKTIYFIIAIAAFIITGNQARAQDNSYNTAVGLKFGGYEIGPSIKWFFNNNQALEGIFGFRKGGVVVTGLYEMHVPIFNVDKLNFFYGGGAHIGGIDKGTYNDGRDIYTNRRILIGFDGVIGAEYTIPNSPISISVDIDPRLELATGSVFDIAPALGLKYSF
ncbi:hypothetical protein [Mucilaginibacter polytrichastri]|uniref:Outer membrane protein beta-barrel domain-containing protein n=1 Tax=Mucilaginibacter polytrichastri TaxID=1302689 RepID=A0A1Q6A1R3_9SPHI|nr:hypothetical protein [Mucilaginibacter polytrichastri]OKS87957.1 hypothetical protein RG47T_3421 [Mucilaginibacter polytrichastri]SFT23355.1 hypothetical protein SAMN04487890_12057 [Mucilaginibacter polytrichastri]